MKFILDVNIALKTVLQEVHTDLADAFIHDYVIALHELIAPDTFPVEAAHVLTRTERQGHIANAQEEFEDLMANSPALLPYMPLLQRALEISRECRIGVYDCLYIALGEREGCEVVTADQKMTNSVVQRYPFVKHLRDV